MERSLPARLSGLIPGIVGTAFRRRGFTEPALATAWRAIVGEETADHAAPLKVDFPRGSRSGGTLHIRVEGAYATDLQHNTPRIVERLNGFYGYAAIARLALHQGPVRTDPAGAASRRTGGEQRGRPTTDTGPEIHGIGDPRLREALRGLGKAIGAGSAAAERE